MKIITIVSIFIVLLFSLFFFKIFRTIMKYILFLIFAGFLFFFITGCSKGNLKIKEKQELVEDNTLTRIQDFPFIIDTKVDIDQSLIMGEGKSWNGQLFLTVPSPKIEVFNFYVKKLTDFGWKEQTTIRGQTSVLNYVGENNRVAIITISSTRFNNSEVLISVAPYTEEFQEKVSDFINEKYLDIKDWQN